MHVNLSNRTAELQQRLQGLEVELLPQNVVYLPIQNMQHRVWRMRADESLALSTNERVPCIISLEVIDHGSLGPSDHRQSNNFGNSESMIRNEWVHKQRAPHRHSTLIDKVATYTQEGLGRLQDTIDHLSHHGDDTPGALDRRLKDFLSGRDSSTQVYNTVGSYESDEEHDEEDPRQSRELSELPNSSKSEDDAILQLPPPPLGGTKVSDTIHAVSEEPTSPTPNIISNSREIQKSPMGREY